MHDFGKYSVLLIIVFSPILYASGSNFGEPNNSVMDNPHRFQDETNSAVDRNLKRRKDNQRNIIKNEQHHLNRQMNKDTTQDDLNDAQRNIQDSKDEAMQHNAKDIQQNLNDEQNKMNAEHGNANNPPPPQYNLYPK